ncbi:MAG TPA: O-antigen ligase family protein [Rubrobacter sp.]|nr:O-antigen ligase family protein [Rubrobacter sp.]
MKAPRSPEAQERLDAAQDTDKRHRPGRMLAVFKGLVMLALLAVTAYAMVKDGFYMDTFWLPAAAGTLALLFATLFARGFYADLPPVGILAIAFLAALVAVKGLSMVWTISETETIKETLRSSMYLAFFVMALGALTSWRQVGPLIDFSVLVVAAVAGYGLLQKINPLDYPVRSIDGVRMDSTLGYSNTTAIIISMGVVLALSRMTGLRSFALRGLYAALLLSFLVALYLTVSRGGLGSLGIGVIILFALGGARLQMLANLLLAVVPAAWLWWRMQGLPGLLQSGIRPQEKLADGTAFRNDLIVALVVAFALQAGYTVLLNRYELLPSARRTLGIVAVAGLVLVACAGTFVAVRHFGGPGAAYQSLVGNADESSNMARRLTSLDISSRGDYWRVGWAAWKEHPFTGTGAGTFQFTWLEERPSLKNVKQVHNLYLEQGTETGLFAFLALVGFVVILIGYSGRAALRSTGERRLLLSGLVCALAVYLISSVAEWHWYIPASTMFFFILAGIAMKLASREDWGPMEDETPPANGGLPRA